MIVLMDYRLDLAPVFQPDLLSDERVLWAGQPRPGLTFGPGDLFLVPFSLLWGGFAIFWEAGALGFFDNHPEFTLFALFGIPFLVIGQYLIWGRFLYKAYRNRRTFYSLTNQRILIVTLTRTRRLQSLFLQQVPTINKSVRRDGRGSLEFGVLPYQSALYANSGMEFLIGRTGLTVPIFYDIADVEAVYQLVMRRRADLQQSA